MGTALRKTLGLSLWTHWVARSLYSERIHTGIPGRMAVSIRDVTVAALIVLNMATIGNTLYLKEANNTLKATVGELEEALRVSRVDSSRLEKEKDNAIEVHAKLVADNITLYDSASGDVKRLRLELEKVPARIAKATGTAIAQYAETTSAILGECTRGYTEMARNADGHRIDAELLMDAWPRSSNQQQN